MKRLTVAILLFPDVEVLDFAGPFEVFSRTRLVPGVDSRRSDDSAPFEVVTVSQTGAPLRATGGLEVVPTHGFNTCPPLDLLVIPGGFGTRALLHDQATLDWIREQAGRVQLLSSVCTGALLLAQAGLLVGRRATTHWAAYDLLESLGAGTITVERGVRWVADGVITSAGVAAGIDMAFGIVEQICGRDVADETASYIEYPR